MRDIGTYPAVPGGATSLACASNRSLLVWRSTSCVKPSPAARPITAAKRMTMMAKMHTASRVWTLIMLFSGRPPVPPIFLWVVVSALEAADEERVYDEVGGVLWWAVW